MLSIGRDLTGHSTFGIGTTVPVNSVNVDDYNSRFEWFTNRGGAMQGQLLPAHSRCP